MIGAIADDITGGTDVAVAFSRQRLRTLLRFGDAGAVPTGFDAVVVALKTRTAPVADAVAQSRRAAQALRAAGAHQLYVKYCSTFDSTPTGNIGPVLDGVAAVIEGPGARSVLLHTPSAPEHGRTVQDGLLLVHGVPLAQTPMRDHPLTPMTGSRLTELLAPQTTGAVLALGGDVVAEGPAAVRAALEGATGTRPRHVLPDAVTEEDLLVLARAVLEPTPLPVVGGSAGLAGALARALAAGSAEAAPSGTPPGRALVLAGSCSARTLEQLDRLREAGRPLHLLDPSGGQDAETLARDALAWLDRQERENPGAAPVVHSSVPPERLREVQRVLGVERAASVLEEATGRIAVGAVERGVTRVVSAGGETSGAVVAALGVAGGELGAEEARGVPWIATGGDRPLHLLLKSGNFGDVDLLERASR